MKKYVIPALTVLVVIGLVVTAINYNRHTKSAESTVAGASSLTISELGIKIQLPDNLRDANYQIGNGPETKVAADFSSSRLTNLGGEACTAGNHVGVSPYPLGEVIVADETPEKVAEEVKNNPDDGLGEFITKVGDKYVYYNAAPPEPCSTNTGVKSLQNESAAALKKALKTAQPVAIQKK
jgi:hypothetical protein